MNRVIVIGAGVSGMTAAICAARGGASVTVLEHMDKGGKKLLMTGNGKCNLTNTHIDRECYNCTDEEFPMEVYKNFPYESTIDFFHSICLYTKEKNGYVYPVSEQAGSVLELLSDELKRLNVKIKYNQKTDSVRRTSQGFEVSVEGYTYTADKCILATGAKSVPQTGSDGSGYEFAKAFSHSVIKPLPSLVALKTDSGISNTAAGVRRDSKAFLYIDDMLVKESHGELQFTDGYISGIMIYELSSQAVRALDGKKKVHIELDFAPDMGETELFDILKKNADKTMNLIKAARSLFNDKLIKGIILENNISPEDVSDKNIRLFAAKCKSTKITVTGCKGFDTAQVTSGGVSVNEVNPKTLESKISKGLYIVGELLDVDGICGGYNLQWAFSTGALAGTDAAR